MGRRVIQQFLHEFEVARLTQHFRGDIVPEVVEPEVIRIRRILDAAPAGAKAGFSDGIAAASDERVTRAAYDLVRRPLRDIREHELGMMPPQMPPDRTHAIRDPDAYWTLALPRPLNPARIPMHVFPS